MRQGQKGAYQESIGRSRGDQKTKTHLRANSISLPIAITLSSGEPTDYEKYEPLMLEPGPEPKVLMADKVHDRDAIRDDLIARKVEPVIPTRRTRKAQRPIDGAIYALSSLIESCFNKLKHSRRLATRYDKTTESYLGFVLIAPARP
jgi:transposase